MTNKQKHLDELRDLLKRTNVINMKNSDIMDYNIFLTLRVENKELYVCRFLADLFQPKGKHGLGSLPLRKFFEIVLRPEEINEIDFDSAEIILEDSICSRRRVDISIYTNKGVYPIEVKIYAGDQDAQLYDYIRYYEENRLINPSKKIYYLTTTGYKASSKSINKMIDEDCIKNIAFKNKSNDVISWVDELLKNIKDEKIGWLLKQFKEIIEYMVNEKYDEISKAVFDQGDIFSNLNAMGAMYKYETELLYEFRNKYVNMLLKKELEELNTGEDEYVISPVVDYDRYKYFDVLRNNTAIAEIYISTNLYISVTEGYEITKPNKKNKTWEYIYRNNKKINLFKPWENSVALTKDDVSSNFKDIVISIKRCVQN